MLVVYVDLLFCLGSLISEIVIDLKAPRRRLLLVSFDVSGFCLGCGLVASISFMP